MTPMIKTQIYFPEADLAELHRVAEKNGKSVGEQVRQAVRRTWLQPKLDGPVALWSGKAPPAIAHDSINDRP